MKLSVLVERLENNHWQQPPHSGVRSCTTWTGLEKEESESLDDFPFCLALAPQELVFHFWFALPQATPSLLEMEFVTQLALTMCVCQNQLWSDLILLLCLGESDIYLSFKKMPQ